MHTMKKITAGLAAAAAMTLLAVAAHAQTGAPAGAAGTAPKSPAITKTAPPPAPAAKAEVKKEAAKKVETKKADAKKGASSCVGLEQPACSSNTSCTWRAAVKRKDGGETRAHCRLNPTAAKASKK